MWEKFDNASLEDEYINTLEAFTFNTKKRFDRNAKGDDTADGMSFDSPEEGCDEKFFQK